MENNRSNRTENENSMEALIIQIDAALKLAQDAPFKPNIIFDLDGVLAAHDWPKIGPADPAMLFSAKQLQAKGHPIIIYTSRGHEHLARIRAWCTANEFYPDQIITGKPLGLIIDDLSINPDEVNDARYLAGLYPRIQHLASRMKSCWVANLHLAATSIKKLNGGTE